jgi:hypothetical protein
MMMILIVATLMSSWRIDITLSDLMREKAARRQSRSLFLRF